MRWTACQEHENAQQTFQGQGLLFNNFGMQQTCSSHKSIKADCVDSQCAQALRLQYADGLVATQSWVM